MKKASAKKQQKKAPLLLTPGPVLLSPSVQSVLSLPMEHHRSPEFKKTLKQVSSDLKDIFQTKEPVLILHSTGTGAMEAAISNSLSPGDEALCVCAGKFGKRWKELAKAFGIRAHSLNVPLGSAVSLEDLEKELKKRRRLKALLISACETSTATEQPIKEMARLLKKYPKVLLIVDGITGLGAMKLPMDKWGLDILIAGSQKSFMIPAGLSFIALSKKAWKAVKASKNFRYYFDLQKEKEAQLQGQTAFSSSVTLIRALKESLNYIKKTGLKNCILNCRALRDSTHSFCKEMGLALYSSRPAHSVTAIQLPKHISAGELKANLAGKHDVILAGGQGSLKNKILRLGHLGPIRPKDHLRALKALAVELKKQDPKNFNSKKMEKALKTALQTLNKRGAKSR